MTRTERFNSAESVESRKMFSKRINILLAERGMSQAQLSRELDSSRTTVCRYVSGEHIPSSDMLIKISNIFGVSPQWLIGQTEEKESSDSSDSQEKTVASEELDFLVEFEWCKKFIQKNAARMSLEQRMSFIKMLSV